MAARKPAPSHCVTKPHQLACFIPGHNSRARCHDVDDALRLGALLRHIDGLRIEYHNWAFVWRITRCSSSPQASQSPLKRLTSTSTPIEEQLLAVPRTPIFCRFCRPLLKMGWPVCTLSKGAIGNIAFEGGFEAPIL